MPNARTQHHRMRDLIAIDQHEVMIEDSAAVGQKRSAAVAPLRSLSGRLHSETSQSANANKLVANTVDTLLSR